MPEMRTSSPVRFIIHGTRDEIVPVWHGQARPVCGSVVAELCSCCEALYHTCVKKGIAYDAFVIEAMCCIRSSPQSRQPDMWNP